MHSGYLCLGLWKYNISQFGTENVYLTTTTQKINHETIKTNMYLTITKASNLKIQNKHALGNSKNNKIKTH